MPPSLECLKKAEHDLVHALKQEVAPLVQVGVWPAPVGGPVSFATFALKNNSFLQAHPSLQCYCIDWTYVRYLRARSAKQPADNAGSVSNDVCDTDSAVMLQRRSWDLHKAAKMLTTSLEW